MRLIFTLLLMIFSFPTWAQLEKRVYAHLCLNDVESAVNDAYVALKNDPNNAILWEAYTKALAAAGDEKLMIQAWKNLQMLNVDENRELIEAMAWGVLNKGKKSSSPLIRVATILGAFHCQDAKGVSILHDNLYDHNIVVRGISLEFVSKMRDTKLKKAVHNLIKNERDWNVRILAIRAAGMMKLHEAKPDLTAIIEDENTTIEEKGVAIESILNLMETVNKDEISKMAQSKRSGLRMLACLAVAFFEQEEVEDLIIPLLHDTNPEVRESAIIALGRIHSKVTPPIHDPNSKVAIAASWLLTLQDPTKGQGCFRYWLNRPNPEDRRFAAAALIATGKYGYPLIQDCFNQTDDPYVKMNLALGMIRQRKDVKGAGEALYKGITQLNEPIMWEENKLAKAIAPSKIRANPIIPQLREATNKLTRLELLNILAIIEHPYALEAAKQFLQQKPWGVSGIASMVLLTEGDSSAVDLVKNLLKDPNPKMRIQAALILAMWGSGEDAITILHDSYDHADRNLKEKILEGIGKIGDSSSIPFLVECLNEPYQTLRIIAASSLIQCLYH